MVLCMPASMIYLVVIYVFLPFLEVKCTKMCTTELIESPKTSINSGVTAFNY